MKNKRLVFLATLVAACIPLFAAGAEEKGRGHNVIVSWDDSGDFGPQTPNTKTAGWQEAIDYCVANGRDLYIKGGWGGRKAVYNASSTIRIPATQDFRIDGGVYVLNWTGPADDPAQDLVVIDSTMNGEYHFGIFVYGGAGAGLRIKPEHPVPIDGFSVVVETEIRSQGIADPSPFTPGERKAGTGLVLDATKAPIVSSRFDFIGGILNFKTCVDIQGQFTQNHFDCLHLHTNADRSALLVLGPECSQNVFKFAIGVDQGASHVNGIDVFGFNNTFEIMTRGGFPKANDVLLEETAEGNRIDLIHGKKEAFEPADFITDKAVKPTNRLTWAGTSPAPTKITPPAGTYTYTQRLYPALARISGGAVSSVQVLRGTTTDDYTASPHTDIPLRVGDQLRLESSMPPEIQIAGFPSGN
jgi:hypothetical protein